MKLTNVFQVVLSIGGVLLIVICLLASGITRA